MSALRLEDLQRCFLGIVPTMIATCGADGEPNVTYISQIDWVDARHVALSCQFFNKTRRNVAENPLATLVCLDPVTFDAYRVCARFLRAETAGALFERMAARIQVIASHTGMAGVFRLLSADVYEVLSLERLDAFLSPPDPLLDAAGEAAVGPVAGPLTEVRGLQVVSDRIARAGDLEQLLAGSLGALDELLGFAHSMVLLYEEPCGKLVAIASRGYGERGAGAEVALGQGAIGTAAERRRMVRVAGMGGELRYGRAIRERVAATGGEAGLRPEIPLPGLCDAQAQLALPLLVGDRLVGVLAVESTDPLCFDEWDEAFLQIVANQIAAGIERMHEDDEDEGQAVAGPVAAPRAAGRTMHAFVLFRNDDCVFADGEYLVRNLPARILWKLLVQHRETGRTAFSNRELRLDPSLGLPPIKDNLESRLILLRKRLAERCPGVRIVPVKRGHFELQVDGDVELVERDSG